MTERHAVSVAEKEKNMTVQEYYQHFCEKIPAQLSLEWDNDGLMCCPDAGRTVKRILIALDITEAVAREAVAGGYDLILSHHPLVFRGVKSLTERDGTGRKLLMLVKNGISAMSFHTRLDAVEGGVNDVLAQVLGLTDVTAFGEEGIGRIGTLPVPTDDVTFAKTVKERLNAPSVKLASGKRPVSRVALLGGSGKDDVYAALAAGADTYLTGELAYHQLVDAPEMGLNLIEAGHFYTEYPVCRRLEVLARALDESVETRILFSDAVTVL